MYKENICLFSYTFSIFLISQSKKQGAGLDDRGVVGSTLGREGNVSLLPKHRPTLQTTQSPLQWVQEDLSSVVKHEGNYCSICSSMLIPVTALSKAWECARLLAGIAGSNPVGDMGVCLL
jgi:hypothetical protein